MTPRAQDVSDRLRSEFLEMPGLRLTMVQVQRLCGVDAGECRESVELLVATGFLDVDAQGRYVRSSTDPVVVSRIAARPPSARHL
jgi:hypothetical protein